MSDPQEMAEDGLKQATLGLTNFIDDVVADSPRKAKAKRLIAQGVSVAEDALEMYGPKDGSVDEMLRDEVADLEAEGVDPDDIPERLTTVDDDTAASYDPETASAPAAPENSEEVTTDGSEGEGAGEAVSETGDASAAEDRS